MSRQRSFLASFLTTVEPPKTQSTENEFEFSSTSTLELYKRTCSLREVSQHDGKKIVEDIVNNIFNSKQGLANLSSSECSVERAIQESVKMDPRLKLWYDTLHDRTETQMKIQRKIGRRANEMLINQPSSVEQRDKGTVQRLMDFATRMNPTSLVQKRPVEMPGYFDTERCHDVNKLVETLPLAERQGEANVEIIGLTRATKQEILGPLCNAKHSHPNEKGKWIDSELLDEGIEKKCSDIKRVLQHYPDVDNLEVVGTNMQEVLNLEYHGGVKDIERLSTDTMYNISSTTQELGVEEQEEEQEAEVEQLQKYAPKHVPAVALKINDEVFFQPERRSRDSVIYDIYFECHPYQNVMKQVLRLENVGRQVITCQWANVEFYKRNPQFLGPNLETFFLERTNFALFPGEIHETNVLFRPRRCLVQKQRWELRVFPNVFCNYRDTIVLKLHGKCLPAPEYTQKVQEQMELVLNKSKTQMAQKLTELKATLVPLIQPHELLCPYERIFDEREIFNSQNIGYHCDRFDDLETLKTLYQSLKKPREPAWDLRLETIKKVILRLAEVEQREENFKKLVEVKNSLKSGAGDFIQTPILFLGHSTEQDRSRFIYVRGSIGNGLEEWEELVLSLEQSSYKSELACFYAETIDEEEEEEDSSAEEELSPLLRKLRRDNPQLYVLLKMRSKKYYRDALYMLTYTHLCDMAENVVSIIESTQFV
ncbi:uncharacterized protein [Drosophila pseudoobscura]|uniref:MYCBP-associated protein n=1 Tax=Drosophila pseudoobscura pseudoobscura TaxID=46245 RepID=A0A6I8V276_DROPS|nr:uncharacterized protein LOC6896859 [Drosophila pseudoobscura]